MLRRTVAARSARAPGSPRAGALEEERDRGERELIVAREERLAPLSERDEPAPQVERALRVGERRGRLQRPVEHRPRPRAQQVRLVRELGRAEGGRASGEIAGAALGHRGVLAQEDLGLEAQRPGRGAAVPLALRGGDPIEDGARVLEAAGGGEEPAAVHEGDGQVRRAARGGEVRRPVRKPTGPRRIEVAEQPRRARERLDARARVLGALPREIPASMSSCASAPRPSDWSTSARGARIASRSSASPDALGGGERSPQGREGDAEIAELGGHQAASEVAAHEPLGVDRAVRVERGQALRRLRERVRADQPERDRERLYPSRPTRARARPRARPPPPAAPAPGRRRRGGGRSWRGGGRPRAAPPEARPPVRRRGRRMPSSSLPALRASSEARTGSNRDPREVPRRDHRSVDPHGERARGRGRVHA